MYYHFTFFDLDSELVVGVTTLMADDNPKIDEKRFCEIAQLLNVKSSDLVINSESECAIYYMVNGCVGHCATPSTWTDVISLCKKR